MNKASSLFLLLFSCSIGGVADWKSAVELREKADLSNTAKAVSRYAGAARFDTLKSAEKVEFPRGVLGPAPLRILRSNVSGALPRLIGPENRPGDFQCAPACIEAVRILTHLDEMERTAGYLRKADEAISEKSLDRVDSAAGQGGQATDINTAWQDWRNEFAALQTKIEAIEMQRNRKVAHGQYVKLHRLPTIETVDLSALLRKNAETVHKDAANEPPAYLQRQQNI